MSCLVQPCRIIREAKTIDNASWSGGIFSCADKTAPGSSVMVSRPIPSCGECRRRGASCRSRSRSRPARRADQHAITAPPLPVVHPDTKRHKFGAPQTPSVTSDRLATKYTCGYRLLQIQITNGMQSFLHARHEPAGDGGAYQYRWTGIGRVNLVSAVNMWRSK